MLSPNKDNPLNPPIFVIASDDGSVDWYAEIDGHFLTPVGHMETTDIKVGNYLAYDATGRLLKLDVAPRPVEQRFLRWLYTDRQEWVTVQAAESEPTHAYELRDRLAYYLSWTRQEPE